MPDQGADVLIRDFGMSAAQAVTQAGMAAIPQIEAWCRELGLDCEFRRVPAQMYSESPEGMEALREESEHARRLIHERSPAQPPRDDEPWTLETLERRITAANVLLCTHPCYMGITEIDTLIAPYQSCVLTARVVTQIPDALFWDDAEPYYYLRVASNEAPRLLVVGASSGLARHCSPSLGGRLPSPAPPIRRKSSI
jgi:glycine/D-amino acid oxidase-like deaminating enzyme